MTKNDANPEPAANAQAISERVLRRDRRRQIVLACVACLLWAAVATGMVAAVLGLQYYLLPVVKWIWREADKTGQVSVAAVKVATEVVALMVTWGYWLGLAMAGAIVLAAVTTLFYVRVSQQANLRSIRRELADISAQLRALS